MPAGVIETRRDQPLDAQLAHIAERHRWAGGGAWVSLDDFVGPQKD
jgi:hypothetical protein